MRAINSEQVAVVVVGFPATPLLLARARICISASHSREDLIRALKVLHSTNSRSFTHYSRNSTDVYVNEPMKKRFFGPKNSKEVPKDES